MTEYIATVGSSIGETIRIFSLFRDFIQTNLDSQNENDEYIKAIKPIIFFVGERSQALILLIQDGYLWDAEIIIRPIMEASLKVLFLSYTTDEERQNRIKEFWEDLSEINMIKQSERAKTVLERTGFHGAFAKALAPLILSDEQERILREKWPRKKRRPLEQKWSFSEIMRTSEIFMSSSFGEGVVHAATHNYGLSSHLIHSDEAGLSLIADRTMRPQVERQKLIYSHVARLSNAARMWLSRTFGENNG